MLCLGVSNSWGQKRKLLSGARGPRQVPAGLFLAMSAAIYCHGSAAIAASGSRLIPSPAVVLSEARALTRGFRY